MDFCCHCDESKNRAASISDSYFSLFSFGIRTWFRLVGTIILRTERCFVNCSCPLVSRTMFLGLIFVLFQLWDSNLVQTGWNHNFKNVVLLALCPLVSRTMFALETINNTLTAIGGWEVKQKKLQTKQKFKCCVSMIFNNKSASFRLSVIF